MTLNEHCRDFRIRIGATLADINGNYKIGALSAFEHHRSQSNRQFLKYLIYAGKNNLMDDFIFGLSQVTIGEEEE